MCKSFQKLSIISMSIFVCFFMPSISAAQAIIADHNSVGEFYSIPMSYIEDIQDNCNFFYGHTSHGSQIMTGIYMVEDENALYYSPYFSEYGDDLGHVGDITWVPPTRSYLAAHPECNMVMWSWCGGASDNTETGINIYLDSMSVLEMDYPAVKFIYMTGHLDGSGPEGNLYIRNNQIRDFCAANGKVLFDFADIESYDPDGAYYPYESDGCGWCTDWCAVHTCPTCGGCAHSHCFNCYQKGKAFWWMMAKIRGWNESGNCCIEHGMPGDATGDYIVNLSDILNMISFVYVSPIGQPPAVGGCNALYDVNGDGVSALSPNVNLDDILSMIANIYSEPIGEPVLCCPPGCITPR